MILNDGCLCITDYKLLLLKLTMVDETTEEKYELGLTWVRVTSYQDYWRELPVTNKEESLSGTMFEINK